jgi:stalled ribosome alternative rescue factor ArfA
LVCSLTFGFVSREYILNTIYSISLVSCRKINRDVPLLHSAVYDCSNISATSWAVTTAWNSTFCQNRAFVPVFISSSNHSNPHPEQSVCPKVSSVNFPGGGWLTASVHNNMRRDAQISFCSLLHATVTSNSMEVLCKGKGSYVRQCKAGDVRHYTQHLATNEGERSFSVSHRPVSCSKMIRLLWNSNPTDGSPPYRGGGVWEPLRPWELCWW